MIPDTTKRLDEVNDWLQKEYAGIRTGQANPGLLDSVKVESYGTYVTLQQVGSLSIEDARTLRLSLWDTSQIRAVEKALQDADLGVSVAADSAGVRIIFPELTSERRAQLLKLAKSKLEDARVSVKAARDEAMKELERQFKAGEVSEDEKFTLKEKIQKSVDDCNSKLEAQYVRKEKELQQ
jgi:ribosome recycling factor